VAVHGRRDCRTTFATKDYLNIHMENCHEIAPFRLNFFVQKCKTADAKILRSAANGFGFWGAACGSNFCR
jgi:hypothetical protein